MKWYEYLFVIVLVLSSSLITYVLTLRSIWESVKVIDVVELINEEKERLMSSDMSTKEREEELMEFLFRLEKIINSYGGIVFIKQSVVGGNYEDITGEVRERLKAKKKGAD